MKLLTSITGLSLCLAVGLFLWGFPPHASADPAPPPNCGNGIRDPGEDCDGNDLGLFTNCVNYDPLTYSGGPLLCNADCSYNFGECELSTCGNRVIDPGELCDEDDLGGQTCNSRGFDGGTLQCNEDCSSFDFSQCGPPIIA